jgi:CDGSH-type Zn-finger protein/uncharacterized Fe-S cluster protein YjdI
MADWARRYSGQGIEVTYQLQRCVHAAECVRGLPSVFDTSRHPWVQPENAGADEIAAVILRCPTGALHFTREDGRPGEPPPERNTVQVVPDGPLYVRGQVTIVSPGGEIILEDTRVALCRCGASENKPFCDNSHLTAGFRDPGRLPASSIVSAEVLRSLKIVLEHNGPLKLQGKFELLSVDGREQYTGRRSALCRCGGSQRKPFCDGSHSSTDFLTV